MLKNKKISFRLPAKIKEEIKQVAERYNLTLSNATLYLVCCGLEVKQDYYPYLYVPGKKMEGDK